MSFVSLQVTAHYSQTVKNIEAGNYKEGGTKNCKKIA